MLTRYAFFLASGFVLRCTLHGLSHLTVRFDPIAGLFSIAVVATGSKNFRGVQAAVGEVLVWLNTFYAPPDAMTKSPIAWEGTDRYNLPNLSAV
jgi:4-hydroxyphenylacetate 3-monooxygenase